MKIRKTTRSTNPLRLKLDRRLFLVDILGIKCDNHSGLRLIEIVPYLHLGLLILLLALDLNEYKSDSIPKSDFRNKLTPATSVNLCLPFLQPRSLRNWSNSSTFREQHEYPLLPSWKMATPGWN
jgi:hypothetical protein